jgi:Transposase IS66 family/zinc-finger binding domain of transposase IS66
MDDRQQLLDRIGELEAENAELRRRLDQLEHQLQSIHRRGKKTRAPKDQERSRIDRRRRKHRKHPGFFRPDPPPGTEFIEHDVHPQQCSHCGGKDLEATGQAEDHIVADIPEPKVEWHRYRRHIYRCRGCQRTCQGRGDLELPGAHIGPRARLLTCYARAHLGISLGKTQNLLHDFFGLTVSRPGLLGHLRWGGTLFAPIVDQLWELLRQSPVVQGDETGWRINGQPAWAWCFRDPRLALFLIDRHRNRDVLVKALGESFAGTLVSDFYAVYNGLDCAKQRCLVHLLRELAKLREELPWQSVRAFIQPLITLFQDAIQLGKNRDKLGSRFAEARQRILDRFDDLLLNTTTEHPQCLRIWRRLFKHCDELFTFLDDPRVPPDNNGTERDIRSLAAARSDGGTHRAAWSATAFARIKSIITTGMKNGVRFAQYGIAVVAAKLRGACLPLPLANTS